ncbi:hypothetical protein J6590_094506 [Homalodisca vitripennis]|nr:hypothetical protein J6590_094506 [Homalodisca vitripennis]
MYRVEDYEQCYQETVTGINEKVREIREEYKTIGEKLKMGGNVAILWCLDAGYVFGTNDIKECFDLKIRELSNTVHFEALEKRMTEIEDVDLSFDSPNAMPCVEEILEEMQLDADKALFAYKRCMYISTGTDYPVTTPHPNPTSSNVLEKADYWYVN